MPKKYSNDPLLGGLERMNDFASEQTRVARGGFVNWLGTSEEIEGGLAGQRQRTNTYQQVASPYQGPRVAHGVGQYDDAALERRRRAEAEKRRQAEKEAAWAKFEVDSRQYEADHPVWRRHRDAWLALHTPWQAKYEELLALAHEAAHARETAVASASRLRSQAFVNRIVRLGGTALLYGGVAVLLRAGAVVLHSIALGLRFRALGRGGCLLALRERLLLRGRAVNRRIDAAGEWLARRLSPTNGSWGRAILAWLVLLPSAAALLASFVLAWTAIVTGVVVLTVGAHCLAPEARDDEYWEPTSERASALWHNGFFSSSWASACAGVEERGRRLEHRARDLDAQAHKGSRRLTDLQIEIDDLRTRWPGPAPVEPCRPQRPPV